MKRLLNYIIDPAGIKYFAGTYKLFGLRAAVTQLSPLANRVIHRKYFKPCV